MESPLITVEVSNLEMEGNTRPDRSHTIFITSEIGLLYDSCSEDDERPIMDEIEYNLITSYFGWRYAERDSFKQ